MAVFMTTAPSILGDDMACKLLDGRGQQEDVTWYASPRPAPIGSAGVIVARGRVSNTTVAYFPCVRCCMFCDNRWLTVGELATPELREHAQRIRDAFKAGEIVSHY